MNNKDLSGIQQNANALNTAAKEGLELLKNYKGFGTDKSVVLATKKVFEFYIRATENEISKITDYYIVNEDFEEIKKSIDNTPERKRTQKQLDAYNAKVKEINKAAQTYNITNQSLNTKRQKLFNNYENQKNSFLDRHIPND
jgi:predicted nuclease with TOPRIM domain